MLDQRWMNSGNIERYLGSQSAEARVDWKMFGESSMEGINGHNLFHRSTLVNPFVRFILLRHYQMELGKKGQKGNAWVANTVSKLAPLFAKLTSPLFTHSDDLAGREIRGQYPVVTHKLIIKGIATRKTLPFPSCFICANRKQSSHTLLLLGSLAIKPMEISIFQQPTVDFAYNGLACYGFSVYRYSL